LTVITSSIGTDGRDYSTMVLWEADLSGAAGGAGNDAVGEAFKDSDFTASLTINDATPDSVKLTAPVAERHDGTAGTGVVVTVTSGNVIDVARVCTIEWIEVTRTSGNVLFGFKGSAAADASVIKNNLVHGMMNTGTATITGISGASAADGMDILNNIIYDLDHDNGTSNQAIGISASSRVDIFNNTVHNIQSNNAGASNDARCISFADTADRIAKNNICTDPSGTTSGSKVCYSPASPVNATMDFNLASDTTASGSNSLNNKTSAKQFVSITAGSEDLHKKLGANAINTGVDLGSTPAGVEIDIDGFNRDADTSRDPWDMGADEFTLVKGVSMPQHFDLSVTGTPVKLGDNRVDQIQLQADAANTDDILWGDSELQNMSLAPNGSQALPAKNLDEVFVKSVSGTQSLHVAFASL